MKLIPLSYAAEMLLFAELLLSLNIILSSWVKPIRERTTLQMIEFPHTKVASAVLKILFYINAVRTSKRVVFAVLEYGLFSDNFLKSVFHKGSLACVGYLTIMSFCDILNRVSHKNAISEFEYTSNLVEKVANKRLEELKAENESLKKVLKGVS